MKKFRFMLLAGVLFLISINSPSLSQVKAESVNESGDTYVVAKPSKRIVPMLTEVFQVSTNQILVTYDKPVELSAGTKASNYWIQSADLKPSGIATVGKNDTVTNGNALSDDKVKITKVQGDNNNFLLTFKQNIVSKKPYKLIICYVTSPGGAPYNSDNGMKVFVGK